MFLQHLGQLRNSERWLLILVLNPVERCHVTLVLVRETNILVPGEEVLPKLGILFHEFRNCIFIAILFIIQIEVYDWLCFQWPGTFRLFICILLLVEDG